MFRGKSSCAIARSGEQERDGLLRAPVGFPSFRLQRGFVSHRSSRREFQSPSESECLILPLIFPVPSPQASVVRCYSAGPRATRTTRLIDALGFGFTVTAEVTVSPNGAPKPSRWSETRGSGPNSVSTCWLFVSKRRELNRLLRK